MVTGHLTAEQSGCRDWSCSQWLEEKSISFKDLNYFCVCSFLWGLSKSCCMDSDPFGRNSTQSRTQLLATSMLLTMEAAEAEAEEEEEERKTLPFALACLAENDFCH